MPLLAPTPDSLQAGRFILRILTPSDWRLEQELSMDDDVIRWTLFPPNLSDDRARMRMTRVAEARGESLIARYSVHDGSDVLGTAGISCSADGTPELMYALLPAGRGRGAATAATRGLSEWALANGSSKVALRTIAGNTVSEAVAQRAGFRAVRRERQRQRDTMVDMRYWTRTR
ncbi:MULTISPECIES: GNAT family N-acetyltransferase [unclassified Arthrobacter]|uniref:GNAT family N-acetyltransferase n=1 Tax=unclassified Arthrobacter TaxID=235627 RepID=UPI001D137639|nr:MULTISPECIES: GNAT family N-acetyltransferase [unclassified Arthrobacter]MCC3274443.1 GNAT family N-acetyltransferase [Arthrobacter sp. zg-Y20]MCC9177967.1 GNAT family N-acetyltransferase [Arthrobacter sp. zg-Y750]MDK1314599.1 GNAT family N-acetyltransferase [Arthrobacter sp. zg.Y20]WIB07581.1 GNAT family N-acetyltransferase [Arthrobacter sp. zg-Y20]